MRRMRTERDSIGDMEIPAEADYGIHTARAVENFPITGITLSNFPEFIESLAMVKKAAALANRDFGRLSPETAAAIVSACDLVIAGDEHHDFVVDMLQGGAGTSTNMNANEVIANIALKLLGKPRGDYATINPNDHVNLSQSTNDVYPTAVRLTVLRACPALIEEQKLLVEALMAKAKEFDDVIKVGRTQLMDAVPMRLGSEFRAFAVTVAEDIERLKEFASLLREVNLGGTAIGTGINTPEGYSERVIRNLAEISGVAMVPAADLIEATSDLGAFVTFSSVLKRIAVKLSKICNDLRLLNSGPRAGLGEIKLPAVQAGSSIMPGKVNPVLCEAVTQVAAQVYGNDAAVAFGASQGNFELNVYVPMMARNVLESIGLLANVCRLFADRCVDGIEADEERCLAYAESSPSLGTSLNPFVGYEKAAALVKESVRTGRSIRELVLEEGLMEADDLDRALDVLGMTKGGVRR